MADGLTEASSTYSVDSINSYLKSHVLKMSQTKNRKNRLAVVSKKAAYDIVKEAAQTLVSNRVALTFQDIKDSNASNVITVFQPWMAAIVAAGMQAAGTYKGIVKKFANVSGVIGPSGFNIKLMSQKEDALKAGLMFMEPVTTGGFRWVSDQMTYSIDNNFVYNSLQANYIADLIVLDLIETFDRLAVGQSVADMTATAGMSILQARMSNYFRFKWIAPSTDAALGYKNATVRISGGVMLIAVEIKLAGILYFVPISLSISAVEQVA